MILEEILRVNFIMMKQITHLYYQKNTKMEMYI